MSDGHEEVIGRKRTADGTLFEIRAIGERADHLTEYVTQLLFAAEVLCHRARKRRREYEIANRRLALVCNTCGDVTTHGTCSCKRVAP